MKRNVAAALLLLVFFCNRENKNGKAAELDWPHAIAIDSGGSIYVADTNNHVIRKITPAGVMTTFAGVAGSNGIDDGPLGTARFYWPWGVATDRSGNVYVADTWSSTIRKITPPGIVTTVAGLAGTRGSTDGKGAAARFEYPSAVAVDRNGNIYVADTANNTVRKITPDGTVQTFAERVGASSVATDDGGNVYVADMKASTIEKITVDGTVTTLAGREDTVGNADGMRRAARFHDPGGVAIDRAGNIYVADTWNSTIRKITPEGAVTTLAGLAGADGYADGAGSAARFHGPKGVVTDTSGNVYVADSGNNVIRKIGPTGVVTTFAGGARER